MSSNKHTVFVLGVDGKPLTPTTPTKARKLLEAGEAKKVWSKFGTFGVQMLKLTRTEIPQTSLGIDNGTKYEGYSVMCGDENPLNVKLNLPDKKKIKDKLDERRTLRRARRFRKCRRRPKRFDNRGRKNFLAPSQAVIVGSRLKVINALFAIYPISVVGLEDVRFNHAAKRWGSNFSTVEVGKARIRETLKNKGAEVIEFAGYETQELREQYGYRKITDKSADKFEAHCCDSLTLACHVSVLRSVEIGPFIAVDDTYRPVRRKLHDTQPAKGGIREPYSQGHVRGLRKGLLIGTQRRMGRLCGEYKGGYRYYDQTGKRQSAKSLTWISSQFILKQGNLSCSGTMRNSPAS